VDDYCTPRGKDRNADEGLTHVVTIRYMAGVTAAHRLKWGTKVLDIEAVLPDERRTELTLLCKYTADEPEATQ
jgi:head-tail adaptor